MQAFTKNPLAEPYVLGISSGASLGAVLAMLLGVSVPVLGKLSVSMGAFAVRWFPSCWSISWPKAAALSPPSA